MAATKTKTDNGSAQPMFHALMNGAGTNGWNLAQELAAEGAHFWARRLRSYSDYMESLAACTTPTQFAEAQSRFFLQAQSDYVAEGAAFAELMSKAPATDGTAH